MRRRIIYFLTIALLFFGVNFFVWNAKSQTNPFTMEQILNAITRITETSVNERKVLSDKILEDVRQRGVDFPLTKENESTLRFWGATDELIKAIRQNSPPLPTPIPTPVPIPSYNDILKAYSGKQYNQAVSLAKIRLSENPKESQTLAVLAQSYFITDDFSAFDDFASQAIETGGSLEFPLTHHHAFHLNSLHRVTLVLTEQNISFYPRNEELPPNSICPNPMFTVDLNQLVSAELVGNLSNEIYLKLIFTKATNSKKTMTIRFADRESYFVKGKKTKGIVSYTKTN